LDFFRSEIAKQFKNGLPAFRSNAGATLHNANASGSITTSIGAKLPTSSVSANLPNILNLIF